MGSSLFDPQRGVSLTDQFHTFLLSQGLRRWEDCMLYKDREVQYRCVQEFLVSVDGTFTQNDLWSFCDFIEKKLDAPYIISHDATDVDLVEMLRGRRAYRRMKAAYMGYYIGPCEIREQSSKKEYMLYMLGVREGKRKLRFSQMIICSECESYGRYEVVMLFTGLPWFIPWLRWNKRYYVRTTCCGTIYELDREVGKRIARGEHLEITPADLTKLRAGSQHPG